MTDPRSMHYGAVMNAIGTLENDMYGAISGLREAAINSVNVIRNAVGEAPQESALNAISFIQQIVDEEEARLRRMVAGAQEELRRYADGF